ncbi:hypothetical protein [Corynebacterium liangguodongii]|uniref:Uncharacterized protein n=1 Tax=Corynebacterium liangguodongii TaxID=2079535 RepID=A0A2S0WEL6_9CORY|nr:hypothetical protein [Corynebacterium liangguodongii]AWB84174.1 hypothetical protein C3E79_06525 [Corynebacterium liangguodongii]PWC00185.1 hypothetical protein DF219_03165 [Corynebacterium liangguodongii]
MNAANRDLVRALAAGLVIAAAVALTFALKLPGLILALALAAAVLTLAHRVDVSPEVASLRASLAISRDDIAETLSLFDDLLTGTSTDAIAARTLYFPALADMGTTDPVIQDFHLRAEAARRFIARVDTLLASPDLDRPQLERLVAVADERALSLVASWQDARRVAREIGPG